MKHFLTGLGLGFGVGLMIAPHEGKQTRRYLKQRANWMAHGAEASLRALGAKAGGAALRIISREDPQVTRAVGEILDTGRSPSQDRRHEDGDVDSLREQILNTATREELLSVHGIGPVLAERIFNNRPYLSVADAVERGVISRRNWEEIKKQLAPQKSA